MQDVGLPIQHPLLLVNAEVVEKKWGGQSLINAVLGDIEPFKNFCCSQKEKSQLCFPSHLIVNSK